MDETTLDEAALDKIISTCRTRAERGDDPGIPVYTHEMLEKAIVALADRRQRVLDN